MNHHHLCACADESFFFSPRRPPTKKEKEEKRIIILQTNLHQHRLCLDWLSIGRQEDRRAWNANTESKSEDDESVVCQWCEESCAWWEWWELWVWWEWHGMYHTSTLNYGWWFADDVFRSVMSSPSPSFIYYYNMMMMDDGIKGNDFSFLTTELSDMKQQ